jgi:low affinity Fe/Cu permease
MVHRNGRLTHEGTHDAIKRLRVRDVFGAFAAGTARVLGGRWAFLAAVLAVVAWAVTGPTFHYSQDWQLVINTGTTIVTFLMVFLIQNSQNRESKAIQLKLDELILAVRRADNQLINIEELTEEQLNKIGARYRMLADRYHDRLEIKVGEVKHEVEDVEGEVHHVERRVYEVDRRIDQYGHEIEAVRGR